MTVDDQRPEPSDPEPQSKARRVALPFGFLGDEEDAPPVRERTPRPSEKDAGRPEKGARPPEEDTEPIPTFAKVTPKESAPPRKEPARPLASAPASGPGAAPTELPPPT